MSNILCIETATTNCSVALGIDGAALDLQNAYPGVRFHHDQGRLERSDQPADHQLGAERTGLRKPHQRAMQRSDLRRVHVPRGVQHRPQRNRDEHEQNRVAEGGDEFGFSH